MARLMEPLRLKMPLVRQEPEWRDPSRFLISHRENTIYSVISVSLYRTCFLLLSFCPCAVARGKQVSIHDPVMAKEGSSYFLFSTGPGITFYSSYDMKTWRLRGRVFAEEPVWARNVAKGFNGHIWAPDVMYHNGRFYLYYSVSSYGKNASAIGLTTSPTLDPESPYYKWEDQGIVVESVPNRDLWNAIDPNLIVDENGTPWLSFGSFWSGVKLVKLDPSWTKLAEPQEWYSIAKRERSVLLDDREAGSAAIEAPFIFKKGGFYYLFVSWDKCCRGKDSTYKMMLGRSTDVRGPYVDTEGRDLAKGGGTLMLAGNEKWPGVGHNSIYTFEGKDYLIFHAYETADNGLQKLKIAEVFWGADGWPSINPSVLDEYQSVLMTE
jgi:arabinan endo-1,5-alpha-L-arabinosidase